MFLSDQISADLLKSQTAVYTGFDPTATSLHVGNLLAIVALLWFKAAGHQVIALIGGATGSIGDPSGRSTERVALDPETLTRNTDAIDQQIRKIFENGSKYIDKRLTSSMASSGDWNPASTKPVLVRNNLEWFRNMSILDFIGDTGRFARVGPMLSRESVKARMNSPEGISFTEFTYQLLQAYDFWHLYNAESCRVQVGGSDQWGNIIAGIELIHKKTNVELTSQQQQPQQQRENEVYGLTLPLVTTSTGEKFGKSAGNAVWLDETKVSHFDFFQFFRRTPDSEVRRYLEYFTFLPLSTISEIMESHTEAPERHLPQRTLAREVTELVHGEEAAEKAQIMTHVLFDGDLLASSSSSPGDVVSGHDIVKAFQGDPRFVSVQGEKIMGRSVVDVALELGAVKSKRSARNLISSGGFYLNKRKIADPEHAFGSDPRDVLDGVCCLFRTGKSNYKVVELCSS
ncbi:tyrosyl-tRNA synthetase [Quaeritorhiza haematococci]|nr:tyrosyl-tRNA synthetase [Quaeritorhiza haematococci]